MPTLSVTKCQGTGNDFILLDERTRPELPYPEIARALCPRRFGVGADGLLVLGDPHDRGADANMRIFNPDGGEAEMCGNGIRCVARYLFEENPEQTECTIETAAGHMQTNIVQWQGKPGVRVASAEPAFCGGAGGRLDRTLNIDGETAPAYAISMGNPHIVIMTTRDIAVRDLARYAAEVDSWKVFASAPNLELARVAGSGIEMRVYERGVGETWACGTGACAAAAVAIATKRVASPLSVATRGGTVELSWQGPGHPMFLTGNAELVFRAEVEFPVPVALK